MAQKPERSAAGEPTRTEPGRLVFRPDEANRRTVVRLRWLLLALTALILVVALAWVVSYRIPSPGTTVSDSLASGVGSSAPEAEEPNHVGQQREAVTRVGEARTPLVRGRAILDTVELLVASAEGRWRRTAALLPVVPVTSDNGLEVLGQVRNAVVTADSGAADITNAVELAEEIRLLSRQPGATEARDLSLLYVAVRRYLDLLDKQARDFGAFLQATEAAVRAAIAGDKAEHEIKSNVANGYLRKCEVRQRSLRRQLREMQRAARESFGRSD